MQTHPTQRSGLPGEGDRSCRSASRDPDLGPEADGIIPDPPAAMEQEILRAVLRSTLDPIVVASSHGIILAASDAMERELGWTPQELIGANVNVLMDQAHRDQHDGYLEHFRRTGITHILGEHRQVPARHKDGRSLPIELLVTKVTVPRRGETLFVGILHDISHRMKGDGDVTSIHQNLAAMVAARTAEVEATHAQLRVSDRLASLGTLATGLGHDMYNILLPLRCRLDMLAAGAALPEADRVHLEAMRQSIDYLQQLAHGLHMLAVDPADDHASESHTELATWWEQVGLLLAKGLPTHVNLEVNLPPELPAVGVEPHRLTQSVLNLLVNAGEAVGKNGQVTVRAQRSDVPNHVTLVVEDDGLGMTPDVVRRALDPFFTTKRRGLGTGMGLSLVAGMIGAAGGSIHLDSETGRGTKVMLNLPVAKSKDADESGVTETPTAVISLSDPRIASIVTALATGAGFKTTHRDADAPGEGWSLWITDRCRSVTPPGQFESSNQIIVVGSESEVRPDGSCRLVREPDDFATLRRSIGEAAATVKGELDHAQKDSNPVCG